MHRAKQTTPVQQASSSCVLSGAALLIRYETPFVTSYQPA